MSDSRLRGITVDASDARRLAQFYAAVLGWEITASDGPEWVQLTGPTGLHLNIQAEPDYERPVWPQQVGRQQKMLHLEIEVDDLGDAVRTTLHAGGTEAPHQPPDRDPTRLRIVLDPDGHPFCLFVPGE